MKGTCVITELGRVGWIDGIAVDNNGYVYYTHGYSGLWRVSVEPFLSQCILSKEGVHMNAMVFDGNNILYICAQYKIYQYNLETAEFSNFAGSGKRGNSNGALDEATFYRLSGITMDKNGDLYVTDDDCIRKITIKHNKVETIAGITRSGHVDGEVHIARFHRPTGIAVLNDGSIFVCDKYNKCIRKITDGIVSTIVGTATEGRSKSFGVKQPNGILLYSDGNLLVTEGDNESIQLVGLHRVCLAENIMETLALKKGFDCIVANRKGDVFLVSTDGQLWKLQNTWKIERILWIGQRKEDSAYCPFAWLPNDIVREIREYIFPTSKIPWRSTTWSWKTMLTTTFK